MSAARRDSAGAYARKLERALAELDERPVLLSPRDWQLIADWHRRGVPEALVLETLADAARRRRSQGPPLRLASIRSRVEESWDVIREGRIVAAGHADPSGPDPGPAGAAWRAAALGEPAGSPLRELLERLLDRLERGEDLAQLDRELDRRLVDIVPAEELGEARRSVETELRPYRSRMREGVLEATRERNVADALRRRRGLARLALERSGG